MVEGIVCRMLVSVSDSGAELLVVLLNLEDGVAGRGDVETLGV